MKIEQRRNEVVRMAEECRSAREIATRFNRSVETIHADLRAMGFPRKERRALGLKVRYRSSADEVAHRRAIVPSLVAQGLSARAIAETFDVSRDSIESDKRATGSLKKNFRGAVEISLAEFDAWIAQGKSMKEMACILGVTSGRLIYAAKKLGWVRPGPSLPIPEHLRGLLPSICGPERLQGLIDEGHSLGKIARHLGVSRQGLSDYCRRKKLKIKPVFNGRRSRTRATPCAFPESIYE